MDWVPQFALMNRAFLSATRTSPDVHRACAQWQRAAPQNIAGEGFGTKSSASISLKISASVSSRRTLFSTARVIFTCEGAMIRCRRRS